ncbi:MAG TPA: prolyl oligopeptidase family serine peptidase [Ktedonobacteraceae bacterium]|nr:prolyl oligopeptidase family serine peptidase [Ktedonobacteraceae bacterium]
MSNQQIAPYGSWKSPITSDVIVSDSIRLGSIVLDGDDIYWSEGRPSEGGRSVIVRRSANGSITDITPPSFNVRTRVQEYGGGAFTVSDGTIYFTNFADQRLYRQAPNSEPEPITATLERRYADIIVDQQRNRLICVCEDHTKTGDEAVNTLVSISLASDGRNGLQTLTSGNDFYSTPRLSPDGSRLAWLTWNHPNMPWDGSELWIGELDTDGSIKRSECIAGGPEESIFQPEWSPDGVLYFISDRSGWWNLYRWRNKQVEPLYEKAAEFGLPQWVFGQSTYAFVSPQRLVCWYADKEGSHLVNLDTTTRKVTPFDVPYTSMTEIRAIAGYLVFLGASRSKPAAIVKLDLATGSTEELRCACSISLDPAYISPAQPIEFPTEHSQTAYAYYYAPHNPDFKADSNELPPLLVISHGGPTAAASSALELETQFWTSRGIAILDVNYGGSTGYGRAYRERLKGQWGVVDVDDCGNGAKYLVERGLADGKRLAIRGGSAGGYTTLCALTFRDTFQAGASYFGVSDLQALADDTHKFESRYMPGLVGPLERRDLYYERSAIHFTDRLSCPIIFFQGLEDKIVLPNQAEAMVKALRAKKLPVAYLAFEGEQHGFRRAENIKRALEAELYFYSRIFKFDLQEKIEPVEIENL